MRSQDITATHFSTASNPLTERSSLDPQRCQVQLFRFCLVARPEHYLFITMDPNAPFLIVAVLIGVFLLIWSSVRSPGPTSEQVALGQHKKKVIPNMMEKCT